MTTCQEQPRTDLKAFCIDLKHLYNSIAKEELLQCVQESIDSYGSLSYQNDASIPEDKFMAMITLFLGSKYVECDSRFNLRKSGVCVGSCLDPIISDLLLARAGRTISSILEAGGVMKVFRFVDDFLVSVDKYFTDADLVVSKTFTLFRHFIPRRSDPQTSGGFVHQVFRS